jgi:hypothetical protein
MKTRKSKSKSRKFGYKKGGAAAARGRSSSRSGSRGRSSSRSGSRGRSSSRSGSRGRTGFKELVDSIVPLIQNNGRYHLLEQLLTESGTFKGKNIIEKIDGVNPADRGSDTTHQIRGWLIQTYNTCESLLKTKRPFHGDPTINHVYDILLQLKKSF